VARVLGRHGDHPDAALGVEDVLHHLPVARLEDVEGYAGRGKEHHVREGKEGNDVFGILHAVRASLEGSPRECGRRSGWRL
jgi:hypothetical protein